MGISKAAEALGSQVEKLITEIDHEIDKFEAEVGNRLQIIKADSQGQLTTSQLELVFKMLKKKNFDQDRVRSLINQFDQDGDGKVFIKDIYELAKMAEEKEGTGIIRNDEDQEHK